MTTFLATAQGHTPGEEWTFGVHFVGSPASLGDAVTSWHTAVNLLWTTVGTATTLQGYTSVVVGIDDVAVAELDDGTGRQVSKEMTALSLVGTALGETLPPQVSGCVSTRTALATKAPLTHTHARTDITGLNTILNALDARLTALEARVP